MSSSVMRSRHLEPSRGIATSQLAKYCAASGISERTIIEDALRKHFDSKDDTELLLRRFDRVEREIARDRRDLELLSEAFGRYMRLRFMAHAPSTAEAQYRHFAQHRCNYNLERERSGRIVIGR
jgi:hypothetical protein